MNIEQRERRKSNLTYLKEKYGKLSAKISDICRYIVFGTIAALWSAIITEHEPIFPNIGYIVVLKFACFYIVIDMFQYLIQVSGYYLLQLYNRKLENVFKVIHKIDVIEIASWVVFMIKIIYLFTFFIVITCMI